MTVGDIWIMLVIALVMGVISRWVSDEWGIEYRFWNRVLQKKWLYASTLAFLLLSDVAAVVLACIFPSGWLFALGGVWLGTLGDLLPVRPGGHRGNMNILSYRMLYDIYVTKADFWEKDIAKRKKKRTNRKRK